MPSDVVYGVARYPGALSVQAATYTLSHGISPGVCVLRMNPQDDPPDDFGDLVFADLGTGIEIVIPDCKLQAIKIDRDDKGFFWSVEIVDRRWRWKELGYINGAYNQLDPFGKLIPWTIRSPSELAELCLTAMGETDYTLNLPPGLNYPGPFYPNPIINISGVNPPVNWEGVPPAQALQQVADRCGCRIIYQLSSDSVLVSPVGIGDDLPDGSIAKRGPTLTEPPAPSAVGVIGSPTRYQARLALTAVGKEWDGSYRPINLLSYAPILKGKPQIATITITNPATNANYTVTISDSKGKPHSVTYVQRTGDTLAMVYSGLAAAMQGDKNFSALTITASGSNVTLQSKKNGDGFNANVEVSLEPLPNPAPIMDYEVTQEAEKDQITWAYSCPPLFPNVQATERLTQADAQRLAQESVFRCYQLTGIDVSGDGAPNIPGYGRVQKTQQIVLQETQVDQIVPAANDQNVFISNPTVLPPDAPNNQNVKIPLTINFYNGYSHDKPAAVYGQICQDIILDQVWYPGAMGQLNTPAGSQVLVDFSVEPEFFLIRFAAPVFKMLPQGTVDIPSLVLQTAVMVRDDANNQLIAFTRELPLDFGDPSAPPAMRHYPDIQANVTSTYDANNRLQSWSLLEQDPITRADYYLAAMANEYQIKGGQIVEYNGLVPIDADGLTWQVTWEVIGGEGCNTTVSQNTEHSIWVPPYPARRRAEFLPPVTAVNKDGERVNMTPSMKGQGAKK